MTGKSAVTQTDWSKVDAHSIQPEEYQELPEWTDEMFQAAEERVGGKRAPRGRHSAGPNKISTTVRFDSDVLTAFRATGKGWQTRMNNALRDWLKLHPSG
ncbi:MAG: BrnA antitoxin family protein [Magnetococcales bacterium]|nr:BrnA antitoxin family protein [Magnetococcales bacterium]